MHKKFICPMMQMQMAAPMAMPEMKEMEMPMMYGMHMPMMGAPMGAQMNMPMMDMDMMYHQEDEEDDEYFMGMYSDASKKMMPYVKTMVDKMEKKDKMMYDTYPDRETIHIMVENTYKIIIGDMPEMAEEEDARQFGRRRFTRDLLALLLFGELFRRRRRRRRRRPHSGFGNPYEYDMNFDYDDYYYND